MLSFICYVSIRKADKQACYILKEVGDPDDEESSINHDEPWHR